jgi:tRNA nucleotidyltransferase (CCA-adding enzyme)
MSSEGWPNPALEADVPALECPANVVAWLEKLPSRILDIASTIAQHGGGIWIVGGAVRDVCLGLDVHDIDFAVSLEPQRMMEIFPDSIPTGIDYGTISIRGEGVFYEATTLRTESNYDDGRRPEQVSW